MIKEMDLEDLGGDEIADDFVSSLVAAIERGQKSVGVYDLDCGVFIRVMVERITAKEFNESPGRPTVYKYRSLAAKALAEWRGGE